MRLGRAPFPALWLTILVLGLDVQVGRAQAVHDGKITGTVMSEDGIALPGATLELSGPTLLGTQTTTTSARGSYVFLNVPVGKYRLTVSRDGFKKVAHDNVTVAAGAAVSLDLTMKVGDVRETLEVVAEAAIVDAKTSSVDSRIDQDLLSKLPTSRDAFYDLALTAPGMFDSYSSNSLPSPTAYGSATNENVFLVNGVNTTDPEAASFGSLVNVNYDAVEEVRIVALGSKAEYGSYSGAAIDVVTKSGSNEFHGSGAFYSKLGTPANNQPSVGQDLGAPFLYVTPDEQLSGQSKKDWEGSGTIGGPILRDKLWFFGAFDYQRNAGLSPRAPLETQSWRRFADAKISAAPFKSHHAWVAYHYENNDNNGLTQGPSPGWETAASYGVASVNHTVSAQWQWFPTGTTTASAKFLGFWKNDKPYLPANAPANPAYINWWKWTDEVWAINGAFPYVDAQKANRQTIQADVSHYADHFLGQHDFKFGVQYTRGRGNRQEGYLQNYANFLYPYRWSQDVSYLQKTYGDTGLLFYNYHDTINPTLTVRTADSIGLFMDDQWTPTRRLTVNLGLRFDGMTTRYGVGEVYAFANSPAQINDPPPVLRNRAASGTIFDFKTIAPRIGLSYMLTPDGKTVARAAYGRYYMPLSVEFLRRFGPDMPALNRETQMFLVGPWDTVDTNGDGMIDSDEARKAAERVHGLTPISQTTRTIDPSWSLNVAPNVKDQHTDQFTFNVERELAKNFSVSASYIYKHTADIFANIPINRVTGQEWEYERVPFVTTAGQTVMLYSVVPRDYNGDGVIDGADVQWVHDHNSSRVQNMPTYDGIAPKRDYHGLQLVFNKRFSGRWQALASFLYSRSSGIGRRTIRQDINVQGPEFWDDTWLGSLNDTINNLDGQLPFTPRYEVKLSGSYRIPRLEVDLGARFRMHTGRPMWQLEAYPVHTAFADPAGGVIDPGGLGRIVIDDPNNATYLPTQALLDLHLERAFRLSDKRSVHLVADGFNMFNSSTPTDINLQYEWGKVTAIPTSRRFRGGVRFEF
jgi:hypothetical protein